MIIDDAVTVDAPLTDVWRALNDVPRVARCIPGASVDEVIGPTTYRCSVKVVVGPVAVNYRTKLTIEELNDVTHRAVLSVDGTETRGRGSVRARVTATAEAAGEAQTRLTLHTDAMVNGVVATVGGRLIEGVAKKTIAEFAGNLSQLIRTQTA